MTRALLLCIVAALAMPAAAAPEASGTDDDEVLAPTPGDDLDPLTCRRRRVDRPRVADPDPPPIAPTPTSPTPTTPTSPTPTPTDGPPDAGGGSRLGAPAAIPPIPNITGTNLKTIADFDLSGQLTDPEATVRALLAPTMQRHRVMSDAVRTEAEEAANAIGYHLVGLGTTDTPVGKRIQLHLAPLPIVRKINVDIEQSVLDVLTTPLFEDEVRRRMRVRPGGYLPWDPAERACELDQERRRIERFLHDEGYFDAEAIVEPRFSGSRLTLDVDVTLGREYKVDVDRIRIVGANLTIASDEIKDQFRRKRCLIFNQLCRTERFTKAAHAASVQKVIELFNSRQYPGVRVRVGEPDFDRATKTVGFRLTIDPRRRIEVEFEGDFTASKETLLKQLTFDEAQSADDVEAAESARAIAAYLQTRGFFDVRVTWHRLTFPDVNMDRLYYRIQQGPSRTVRGVSFTGNLAIHPNRGVAEAQLLEAIVTKPIGTTAKLLGARAPATSANLVADAERIRGLYRRLGYRDARVDVTAATSPAGLDSAALAAGLQATDEDNDIYVRFHVDAGQPTLLTQINIDLGEKGDELATPEDRALCIEVLGDLARFYQTPQLAQPVNNLRCIATAPALTYRELEVADTRDVLRDRLFSRSRPRTTVEIDIEPSGTRRMRAVYKIKNAQLLKVGTVVLRGNFRTRDSIIRGELAQAKFRRGLPLTANALAEASRRLRNTGLFESVNVRLLDLETTTAGALNAVVEVTERYDYPMGLDLAGGGSSFNGVFVNAIVPFKNLMGTGVSLDLQGTVGLDGGDLVARELTLKQLAGEATLRIPQWISRRAHIPLEPQIELSGFHRLQDTPRFGRLTTSGATTTLSRTFSFPRTETRDAHAVTGGVQYNYRRRQRNVDVLRPVGADDDESQVPITTTTGAVGLFVEWEHRNDRAGQLQPLAPEAGFRLEGQLSLTHPVLSFNIGQDFFLKASAVASKYWPIGKNLVFRLDGRYDHGFPLGGAALLPEVERFFGGGDASVRGYEDDRLATELIEVAVPPLENLTQIRVLPAGGNIRTLMSADAQIRIYKLLSTAVFFDAGIITNQWSTVTLDDIRPSVGMALVRVVTPFGAFAWERAVPLRPRLGDDPRGRWHVSFAARAQF